LDRSDGLYGNKKLSLKNFPIYYKNCVSSKTIKKKNTDFKQNFQRPSILSSLSHYKYSIFSILKLLSFNVVARVDSSLLKFSDSLRLLKPVPIDVFVEAGEFSADVLVDVEWSLDNVLLFVSDERDMDEDDKPNVWLEFDAIKCLASFKSLFFR